MTNLLPIFSRVMSFLPATHGTQVDSVLAIEVIYSFDFTNLLPIFRILWTLLHLLKTHHPDETARTPHGPCQRCQVGHATPALATRAAPQQRAPSLLAVYQSLYRGAVVSWDLVLD